jgi:acyl carrier protein
MIDRVKEIIANITNTPVSRISEKSNDQNLAGWDSMAQINIVVALEAEFGVSFTAEEMSSLNSVTQILEAIQRNQASR